MTDFKHLEGKTGRIYVARGGTVSVFVLRDAESWLHSNTGLTSAIHPQPVREYWVHTAEEAPRYMYKVMQMSRDSADMPHYIKQTYRIGETHEKNTA